MNSISDTKEHHLPRIPYSRKAVNLTQNCQTLNVVVTVQQTRLVLLIEISFINDWYNVYVCCITFWYLSLPSMQQQTTVFVILPLLMCKVASLRVIGSFIYFIADSINPVTLIIINYSLFMSDRAHFIGQSIR